MCSTLYTDTCQTVVSNTKAALEDSAHRYQELYAQYLELNDTLVDNATHVTGQAEDIRGYIVAIIDAHSHNVCLCIALQNTRTNYAMQFMDSFLKGGVDDGAVAAKRVQEIINEMLRHDYPDLAGQCILVRVYGDVQILSARLGAPDNGEKHDNALMSFVQKFSSASPFSDFINVLYDSGLTEKILGKF